MNAAITVSVYAAMIADRMHFAQASYRDGEWSAILGWPGHNVNGEEYVPPLGALLRHTLQNPRGQWCIFWPAGDAAPGTRRAALDWINTHRPEVRWIHDRPFGRANETGCLAPFFQALRGRRVIVVGPAHIRKLDRRVLAPERHVEVRDDGRAWEHVDDTVAQLVPMLRSHDIVLFAAGMASNLLIWRLLDLPGVRGSMTLIDIGAVLDPYCGVFSRRVYRTPQWQRYTMPRNIPDE